MKCGWTTGNAENQFPNFINLTDRSGDGKASINSPGPEPDHAASECLDPLLFILKEQKKRKSWKTVATLLQDLEVGDIGG